jgi:ABC-2 type transport system permease protein
MIALVRTEFTKATWRLRTLIIAGLLIGLPAVITVAVHSGRRGRGDNGEGLFLLAQQSGLIVPAAVLNVMSRFLLIVIAGVFAADSVAGDAAWGNLRYLLMRPVSRVRLLMAKGFVAGVLIWACIILVAAVALLCGIALFGAHPVTVPGIGPLGDLTGAGFQLDTGALLARVGIATLYVAFGFTALLALGTFLSTLTDSPAGAIGATVGIYIVSEILDGITQFGVLRYGLPTHYLDAWQTMFTANSFSQDMLVGIVVQVIYLLVFGAAAVVWFRRKDIRS